MHPAFLLVHPAKFLNGKNAPNFFLPLKRIFFRNAVYVVFVGCASLVFSFSCGIVSGSWVRWERLGAVKVKVPVLSVAVVGGSKRGTQKVVTVSGMYGSLTDQVGVLVLWIKLISK